MSRVAMVFVLLGISGTALAGEDGGWYLAANYGRAPKLFSRSDLDEALVTQFDQKLALESTSVEKKGTIWSAGVGYRMGQNFALEATYFNLGKIHYHASGSVQGTSGTDPSNLDLDTKSRGGSVALVWSLPLWNAWGIDARAGAYRGSTSTQFVSTVGENSTSRSMSEKSTSLMLGIGGSYIVDEHVVVRLDYLHLNDIKERAFETGFDADVVTAGITYNF